MCALQCSRLRALVQSATGEWAPRPLFWRWWWWRCLISNILSGSVQTAHYSMENAMTGMGLANWFVGNKCRTLFDSPFARSALEPVRAHRLCNRSAVVMVRDKWPPSIMASVHTRTLFIYSRVSKYMKVCQSLSSSGTTGFGLAVQSDHRAWWACCTHTRTAQSASKLNWNIKK